MPAPFNIPDEFFVGFAKSSQAFAKVLSQMNSPASTLGADQDKHSPGGSQVVEAQANYAQQVLALWGNALAQAAGQTNAGEVIEAERGDRRFRSEQWRKNPWFSLLKQTYLMNSKLTDSLVDAADLDAKEKHKLRFFTRQFIDAMSPTNFAVTNPDVVDQAVESNAESVMKGYSNFMKDYARGRISITDESAFEIGVNVATSPGSIVFENDLIQLIQYEPATDKVAKRPLLIVPPCINKFYILDLQPENSFVRFAVEQGHTVFLISWCNPQQEHAGVTWDMYLEQGPIKAIDVALEISGADKVNALGWCVGGTILSSALAVLRHRGQKPVASLTLLTTMLDFEEPGDLGVFIDEQGVSQREKAIGKSGLYPGKELGFVFQTLRANDLIWPYISENYLKGKAPPAFDLLYWNADATNLAGPMYAWYLRNMYLENNLREPDRLTMLGSPVDLKRIDMPSYVFAAQDDHIVPWRSAFQSGGLFSGESQFVLGASGHIAGVINPPSKNKRNFWSDGDLDSEPEQWLATAQATPGSWWKHWEKWLRRYSGTPVAARHAEKNKVHKPIEAAPGRYVKVRV